MKITDFGNLMSCSLWNTNILKETAASADKCRRHVDARQHGFTYQKNLNSVGKQKLLRSGTFRRVVW
jgi:hypothetical protein